MLVLESSIKYLETRDWKKGSIATGDGDVDGVGDDGETVVVVVAVVDPIQLCEDFNLRRHIQQGILQHRPSVTSTLQPTKELLHERERDEREREWLHGKTEFYVAIRTKI